MTSTSTKNKEKKRFTPRDLVPRLFDRMLAAAGPRHWWPCDSSAPGCGRDEMIIGAVLTQNTAWVNVERALANLRAAGLLHLSKLALLEPEAIAPLITPAGYFNLKARRLRAVCDFFAPEGQDRFEALALWPDDALRAGLLAVWGVGPETADSILLYAFKRLSFVIDAYTLRIGRRHGLFEDATSYEDARALLTAHARPEESYFNEYHALLVWIGKHFCRPTPLCPKCPLFHRECFATAQSWRAMKRYSQQP